MLRLQHWLIVLPSALAIIALLVFLPKTKKNTTVLHNHEKISGEQVHFSIPLLEKQTLEKISPKDSNQLSALYADTASDRQVYKTLSDFCTQKERAINPILSIYYDYQYTQTTIEEPSTLARKARFLHILALETKDKHIHNSLLDWSLSLLSKASQQVETPNDSVLVDMAVAQLWYLPEEGRTLAPPMQAIAKLKAIVERNPSQTYALYMLGMASLVSNQSEKAIQYFEKTLKTDPNNKNVLQILANLYTKLDKPNKAKKYQQALAMLTSSK